MKLSKAWRELSRDQKRAWSAWAKSNKVLLPDGNWRRVSGHKAMSVVLANRALAGEAANPGTVPAAVAWLDGALSLRDAGPFTSNAGFVGFRAEQAIAAGTKWFVWATPPAVEALPAPALRRDESGLHWDWGWNPTGGWDIHQSFDGGATFQVEEAGLDGAVREYAPADATLPTFIVGKNANGTEATGRSGVVSPEHPSAPSVPLDPKLNRRLRFVTVLAPGALNADDITASLGAAYAAVNGSWDGPGADGEWPEPTFVWFRVHQYANGQLSPGVVMRGQISVEL
jgi:hypothetical protein